MGTLGWTVDRAARLVTVRGVGVYDLSFAMALGAAMWAEDAVGYCKLLDLSQADIRLSDDDMQVMVAKTCLAGATTAGPIAVVLGPHPDPLVLDMAVLLKSRIGNRRRFRVFTDEWTARRWLSAEARIVYLSSVLSRLPSGATRNGSFAG